MSVRAQFLDVVASQFPVDKLFSFARGSYLFRFRKNTKAANVFYTVEIFAADGRTFLYSNKIVYEQELLDSILAPFIQKIIPLNLDRLSTGSGVADITDETLGREILLCTSLTES